MTEIVPAIDIIEGRCVRLTRGDYAAVKVYDASPVDSARCFADCGVRRIHLVDLDGAKAGTPCNLSTLEAIANAVSCELEWGGGVASEDALRQLFDAGATHAIIGSIAALQPERFAEWLARHGSRMILGADVRNGRVAVRGWQEEAPLTLDMLLHRFTDDTGTLLREVIVTDIGRDGMLQGPSLALYSSLVHHYPALSFTASGGVSSMDDILALTAAGVPKAIVGKAFYENRITLKDISLWSQNASSPASTSKMEKS